jgi:hypothetical protein
MLLLLLCSVGLWSCAGTGRYLGPTTHGYEFHASLFPSDLYFFSDILSSQEFPTSATLLVQVHDTNGAPATGVPVTVQFAGSECQGVIRLSAQQAVTAQGRASFTVRPADTSGACRLAVRVDNVTQDLWVSVSPPPSAR